MKECLFCSMLLGKVAVDRVYENEWFFCVRDLHPQAETHLLIISKEHQDSLKSLFEPSSALLKTTHLNFMNQLFQTVMQVSQQDSHLLQGFRCVLNTGAKGGQSIFHFHLHVLGGASLQETLA